MSVNALIAQGMAPIGGDLPQIAQMLQQKKQYEDQQQQRNALFSMQQDEFNRQKTDWQNSQSDRTQQLDEKKLQASLANVEWALQPGVTKDMIERQIPEVVQGYESLHGPGSWPSANENDVKQSAFEARIKLASTLRQGPLAPKAPESFNLSPGGQHFTMGPDGKPTMDASVPASPPAPKQPKNPFASDGLMWVYGDNGQIEPSINPITKKQMVAPAAFAGDRTGALALRNSFEAQPFVKEYSTLRSRIEPIADFMMVRTEAPIAKKAVGDNGLVKAYITVTRAEGTRESTLSTSEISKLPGLPQRIQAAVANLALGKHLPDDIAAELWTAVSSKMNSLDSQVEASKKETLQRAQQMGYSPQAVFGDAEQ